MIIKSLFNFLVAIKSPAQVLADIAVNPNERHPPKSPPTLIPSPLSLLIPTTPGWAL